MELWADIKGFENYYQISNLGNIKSMGHEFMCKDGKIKSRNPKILKPCVASTGYLHINLCRDGIRKSVTIHSLVANHFIDNPQNFKEIDHLNGIKNDNRVINLKWVTRQGNLLSQNWKGTPIKRGQVLIGREKASKNTGLTESEIRTCIKKLLLTKEITSTSTNKNTLITICKYDVYQGGNYAISQQNDQQTSRQLANRLPTNDQQSSPLSIIF